MNEMIGITPDRPSSSTTFDGEDDEFDFANSPVVKRKRTVDTAFSSGSQGLSTPDTTDVSSSDTDSDAGNNSSRSRKMMKQHSLRLAMDGALHETIQEEDDENLTVASTDGRPLHLIPASHITNDDEFETSSSNGSENAGPSSQPDYGYGDATPQAQPDYGYGDTSAPSQPDYGYGDATPQAQPDYGYGDYGAGKQSSPQSRMKIKDFGDSPLTTPRPRRRGSVTKFSVGESFAQVQMEESQNQPQQRYQVEAAKMASNHTFRIAKDPIEETASKESSSKPTETPRFKLTRMFSFYGRKPSNLTPQVLKRMFRRRKTTATEGGEQ